MKEVSDWYSPRVEQNIRLARWGHWGTPVLIFPTAGGDAEEIERFLLIDALAPLISAGRIKVYSCDSIAGRAWTSRQHPPEYCALLQNRYDECVYREVVPAIWQDCGGQIEIVTAGSSIGAFNAVAALCRHPDVFRLAFGLSGTYDLEPKMHGQANDEFYFGSPLHFLPNLGESLQLEQLRQRFAVLAFGQGRWEDPEESWRLADVLGSKGVPNRVDPWGPEFDHDWPTWRVMMPKYFDEWL